MQPASNDGATEVISSCTHLGYLKSPVSFPNFILSDVSRAVHLAPLGRLQETIFTPHKHLKKKKKQVKLGARVINNIYSDWTPLCVTKRDRQCILQGKRKFFQSYFCFHSDATMIPAKLNSRLASFVQWVLSVDFPPPPDATCSLLNTFNWKIVIYIPVWLQGNLENERTTFQI